MEKELEATRQKQAAEEDEKQRTSKRKNKDALIDDLVNQFNVFLPLSLYIYIYIC